MPKKPPETDYPTFEQLSIQAGRIFTPAVPVNEDRIFAGRSTQIESITDAIDQAGQHIILYGERGVGKTSLANVIQRYLIGPRPVVCAKVNCLSTDTYSPIWRRMFESIKHQVASPRIGFKIQADVSIESVADRLPDAITPDHVRATLTRLGAAATVVLIFDEFDTIRSGAARRTMSETVKLCSDFEVPATLLLVGVADNVGGLLKDHRSIERALVQVQMPRMSDRELAEILKKGAEKLGTPFAGEAVTKITRLSKGLPHYTHLLGLHAVRAALAEEELEVGAEHVTQAIEVALANAHQSTIETYNKATASVRVHTLFKEVLLAAALAPTDELGWFTAATIRDPLNKIVAPRAKPYNVPAYIRHLNAFATEERGSVLQRVGVAHKFRFRFDSPIMQPYVILRGHAEGQISDRSR